MRKLILLAAVCLLCLTGAALAAEKCSTLQIPVSGCKCDDKCVSCTYTDNCGNCHDVEYGIEGCGTVPVAKEECRTIDPACAPGSQFCLLDASRAQYTMCCIGDCFTLLSKTQKDLCPKCKSDCGCKDKCGCKQSDCGCKQKDCGCKDKCGCKSKCQSCTGECGCYMPYAGYTPRPKQEIPAIPPPYVYIPVEEAPAPPKVVEVEPPVIKVEGRG